MGDVLNYFEIAAVILEELQTKQPELSKEVLEGVRGGMFGLTMGQEKG